MKVIVMGCGRVGEQLAWLMSEEGHDVAVIDQNPAALLRLGPHFKGQPMRGVGFDRGVLLKAGIEEAEGFAATSSSDNANIIAARIARNVFHVPKVVARLYDPRRAEIYRRLGLVTISSTTWGAGRIRELLVHSEFNPVFALGNGEVSILTMEVPPHLVGRTLRHLNVPGELMVTAVTREGRAFIPTPSTEFHEGDVMHLAVLATAQDRLASLLGEV